MHFDLFDLRLFVAVAEESNLRRGAERACISLAAASTRIKQLEENIGGSLFYRKPSGFELTPAGEAMLHHARRVLQQVDHLKCDLRDYTKGLKGHVRMLANTTSISGALPPAMASFLAQYPDVSIDLRERLSEEIVLGIHEAHADIGIVAGNVDTRQLEVYDFASDELVLVVPQQHQLAQHKHIRFIETLEEPHISLSEGSALAGFLPPLAKSVGHQLIFRIQVNSFESICLLVAAGVGVGVIPRSAAKRHAATMQLRMIALSDDWAVRESKLVCRAQAQLPKITQALVQHLSQFDLTAKML